MNATAHRLALVGLIVASVINIFMQSGTMALVISFIGVLIFAGLTAYDTQKLKDVYAGVAGDVTAIGHASVRGALALYLDFINLFVMLMRLMGDRRG